MYLVPGTDLLLVSWFYTDNIVIITPERTKTERLIPVDRNPTSIEVSDNGTKHLKNSLVVIDLQSYEVRERYKLLFGAYAFQQS